MKKIHLLLAFMLFSIAVSAQENWITKQLDGKLSVKFPSEPQKMTKNGADSFVAKEKDSVIYSAGSIDMYTVAKMDSAALAPLKDNPMFAEKLIAGVASQKSTYKFGEVKLGKWNGLTTYNVVGTENANKNTLHIQMIFVGSKLYTLTCRVPAEVTTKSNELFFNSAAISK